jgi:hypothetical protein
LDRKGLKEGGVRFQVLSITGPVKREKKKLVTDFEAWFTDCHGKSQVPTVVP